MIEIEFKLDALDKLKEALRRAPARTVDEIGKAVQKSALIIQSNAIREAPVNKQTGGGNLRQNIRTSLKSKLRAEVISKAPYSGYVEYGTAPHIIVPVNKKALANTRTGQFFGKVVHHPGTKANPYMHRALEKSRNKINEFFRNAVENVFKSLK
jgi:HK97 gp10 family phage protein